MTATHGLDLSRQQLLVPRTIGETTFLVIGAGSLGSNVTNVLCRLGAGSVTVFDRDTLSSANVAPGFAGMNWLGEPKVGALANKLYDELGVRITPVASRYKGQRVDADIVVVTVDSMQARRDIWAVRQRIEGWVLWIDTRMGKDQAGVYVVRTSADHAWYEASIAREGAALACGEKATAPISVGLVPGFVGTVVMRYLRGRPMPRSMFAKVLLDDAPFISVDMG